MDLGKIYEDRFGYMDERVKNAIWLEIGAYLQRWIPKDGRVVDVACDAGYFIRHIEAAERWATDIRDVSSSLGPEVRFVQIDGLLLSTALPRDYFDVAFASNYLEHLSGPDAVIDQLREMHRVLRPDGLAIILQPNIRYVGGAYWDFIDHRVPLTERSLVEAANAAGFQVERVIKRFLPYTTKSRIPRSGWLARIYLKVPLAWRLLGKQTLLIARASPAK